MNDPRMTPANGRVAHVSLEGRVEADRFVEGEPMSVTVPVTAIRSAPGGVRDRELILGQRFLGLEVRDGWVFGMAERDGYVGHVAERDLGPLVRASHVIGVARSYAKPTPDLKHTEPVTYLSYGSLVDAGPHENGWVRVAIEGDPLWVPSVHLRRRDVPEEDPVAVARLFLGTPYLWGGNSAFGIDCSGLVQAALLACGIPCPGDSDQQRSNLGETLGEGDAPRRGDLYFWKGHVGLLSGRETLLHATAHAMAVVEEPLSTALSRITERKGLPVLRRARIIPPGG